MAKDYDAMTRLLQEHATGVVATYPDAQAFDMIPEKQSAATLHQLLTAHPDVRLAKILPVRR